MLRPSRVAPAALTALLVFSAACEPAQEAPPPVVPPPPPPPAPSPPPARAWSR